MVALEQFAVGKSVAELNVMAEQLETMADMKAAAAAAAKTTVAKGTVVAKTAAVKTGGMAGGSATAASASLKSGATKTFLFSGGQGTIWTGKGLSLGLGIGLGAWGPILLVVGGVAGLCAYRKYSENYRTTVLDEPTI